MEAQMAQSSACSSRKGKHDLCDLHDVSNTVQVTEDHGSRGGWSLERTQNQVWKMIRRVEQVVNRNVSQRQIEPKEEPGLWGRS